MLNQTITLETRISAERMRELYDGGHGVAEIMDLTGKAYIEVQESLRRAQTNLITGGPHDLEECTRRHRHKVATYVTWRLEH